VLVPHEVGEGLDAAASRIDVAVAAGVGGRQLKRDRVAAHAADRLGRLHEPRLPREAIGGVEGLGADDRVEAAGAC
jgi:hypothetical protein